MENKSLSLAELNNAMRQVDICMMTTLHKGNVLDSRPMSNNKEVDYNGKSYFFSNTNGAVVADIQAHPFVNLSFIQHHPQHHDTLYISIEGKGEIIHDRQEMKKHWVHELDKWFEKGLEDPDAVMITVQANTIRYWHGTAHGLIELDNDGD